MVALLTPSFAANAAGPGPGMFSGGFLSWRDGRAHCAGGEVVAAAEALVEEGTLIRTIQEAQLSDKD